MSDPIHTLYTESREQSGEYLRQALPEMARRGIPPNPHNFALWYVYTSGSNKELRETMDRMIQAGEKFTAELSQDLYLRFFVQNEDSVEKTRRSLRDIIVDIQGHIRETGGNLAQYAGVLDSYAQLLGSSNDILTISDETGKVLSETKTTEYDSQALDTRLSSMVMEVESLRRELECIREESLTDGLTAVGNRKAFDIGLSQAIRATEQKRIPFSVLMADIDHFKKFNDSYGHLVGDRVLRYVSTQLRQCLKGYDKPYRYGGEEFAVILPKTFISGAATLAEQIRMELSANELKDRSNRQTYGRITISIGVAQYRNGEAPDALINRVDKALYKAKQNGRDRVVKAG